MGRGSWARPLIIHANNCNIRYPSSLYLFCCCLALTSQSYSVLGLGTTLCSNDDDDDGSDGGGDDDGAGLFFTSDKLAF